MFHPCPSPGCIPHNHQSSLSLFFLQFKSNHVSPLFKTSKNYFLIHNKIPSPYHGHQGLMYFWDPSTPPSSFLFNLTSHPLHSRQTCPQCQVLEQYHPLRSRCDCCFLQVEHPSPRCLLGSHPLLSGLGSIITLPESLSLSNLRKQDPQLFRPLTWLSFSPQQFHYLDIHSLVSPNQNTSPTTNGNLECIQPKTEDKLIFVE